MDPLPSRATSTAALAARPLGTATEVVRTPIAGVVAYHKALGDWVQAGECVADCIDPLTGEVARLCASQEGLFFAREWQRFAPAGRPLFKVAGRGAVRSGKLSSD